MEQITKREFISQMESAPHMFLGVTTELVTEFPRIENINAETRTVERRQTNCLIFSTGSRLYFDGFATNRFFVEYLPYGKILICDRREKGSLEHKYMYYAIRCREFPTGKERK